MKLLSYASRIETSRRKRKKYKEYFATADYFTYLMKSTKIIIKIKKINKSSK